MKKFVGYLILALVFILMGILLFIGFYLKGLTVLQSIGATLSMFAVSIILTLVIQIAIDLTV